MNDALDRIIAEIKAEYPRSLFLHPPEEWAEFDLTEMLQQVDKEVGEIWDALIEDDDYYGEHGVYREINHAIIVLLRMRMELERRER